MKLKLVVFICLFSSLNSFVYSSNISSEDETAPIQNGPVPTAQHLSESEEISKEDDTKVEYIELYDSYVIRNEKPQAPAAADESAAEATANANVAPTAVNESVPSFLHKNSLTVDSSEEDDLYAPEPNDSSDEHSAKNDSGWETEDSNEHEAEHEKPKDDHADNGSDAGTDYNDGGNSNEDFFSMLGKIFPCFECDSRIDGGSCLRIESLISTCHSEIGQCYTAFKDGDIIRGCVGDGVFPNIESTKQHEGDIKLCNNDRLCNDDKIEDTCIVCHGEKCDISLPSSQKACSFGQPSGCYLSINENNEYERGCLRDLSEEKQHECTEKGSRSCQSCFTHACNQKSIFDQQCYYCNGTTDGVCQKGGLDNINITCIGYSSVCITGIDANGFTHRQCSLNDEKDTARFPNGFKTCYEDNCNGDIYPENRLKCFRCAKGRNCDQPAADLRGEICRVYPDECFTYGKEDGQMHRGCMSDRSKSKLLCQKNNKDCHKCNSTDCNYLQSFQLKNLGKEILMDGPMFDQLFADTNSEFGSSSSEHANAQQSDESDTENAYPDDGDSEGAEGSSETNSDGESDGETEHKPSNKPVHKPDGSSAQLNTFCVFTVAIAALFTQSLPALMKF